ncbi:MAG: methyl-accepting chemotaxis protein [Rhodoferax sp.]
MLTNMRIQTRLYIGFGVLVFMAVAVIGIGWFGLNVAVKGLDGITGRLIPINIITARAKYAILESKAAHNGMVAALGDAATIQALKAEWDQQQQLLDQAGSNFGNAPITEEQKKNLALFRTHLQTYRAAVRPVADKLLSGGFATPQEAWQAMQAADQGFKPMVEMLAGIENALQKGGADVFGRINTAMSSITLAFLAIGAVSVACALLLGWRMAHSLVHPIHAVSEFAERMSNGDLSQPPLVSQGKDELAHMTLVLDHMQKSLVDVIGKVRDSAEHIKLASSEVASGNQDLSARTEQAASNLEQTASSMEEMSEAIKHSADNARLATQLAQEAERSAQQGGEVVGQVVTTMADINQSSRRINDIIGVIDGIAFQTNILALNAAVEAARAGEQGRGFAVVASEVRSLAQRSAEAAKEIKALISDSVGKVEHGSTLVGQAGSTMEVIVANVLKVREIIGEMSAAATEQADGVAQINAAIANLDQMTQQNAALVEQGAAAASSMSDQAAQLNDVVGVFRLQTRAAHGAPLLPR